MLAADGSELIALTSSDRQVVRLPARDVEARELCRARSEPTSAARDIAEWLTGDPPRYPRCVGLDEPTDGP